ncbi:hypothetical protein KAJ89_05115 [Candidatus Parcubacteria bacterium]|nr:hypothetical protein [Candidatus Parcubacteria bacterium]
MPETKPLTKTNTANSKILSRSSSGLDFIITGAIMLVFFLCPLFFTGLVAQGIGFEKMVLFYFLVLIGVVAWVTKGVITGELKLKRTPLDIPILAALVIFAISTVLSVSTKDSLIGAYGSAAKSFSALVVFALFYYLVVNNLDLKKIKKVFWSFIASSCILIVFSLLQLMEIHILPFESLATRGFNPIGSLSGLTMFVLVILPLLVVAITQIRELMPRAKKVSLVAIKVLLGLVAIAGLAILALLNGFTFWPIGIVGLVIVLMFFLAKIIKVSGNNIIIPLATFLALIILLVLGNFNLVNMGLPAEISLSRQASWDISKSAVMENPIFGSGPSTFYYDFAKFKSGEFNNSALWNVRFDSASGSLFEILSTAGLLGLISVIVIILISLSVTFLTLIKTNKENEHSILLGLFASFISVLLFAILFALNNAMILVTILIAVFAVASSLVMYPEKFKEVKLSFRSSPKYALALAAIFLCVSAGVVVLFTMGLKMYLADMYARQALDANKPAEKIQILQRAVALAPYQDAYYINLANNYMALANRAALSGKAQTDVGVNLSQAIEQGKMAVEISGNRASNNESLALIYENASFYTRGALEWAEQLYNKVIELDPKNPTPHLRIALVNMARANAETDPEEKKYYISEAIKKYDDSIAKKGDLAAAYYGKAIASEKLGDIDDAIEQLKRASLVARNNLDYRFELGRLYFNRGVSQPQIAQDAFDAISKQDLTPDLGPGTTTPATDLSVTPAQETGSVVKKNSDLQTAEQLFLSIVAVNQNHANAIYSLAVLYQKTGETSNLEAAIDKLLSILRDEASIEAVKKQFADILE